MSSTLWEVQLGLTSDVERILNHKRRSNETRQVNQPKPRRRPAVQKLLVFRNPVECTRTALWLIANYNRIELANQKPQPMYLLNCLRINLLYYFQFAPSLVPSIVAFGTIKSFVRFVSEFFGFSDHVLIQKRVLYIDWTRSANLFLFKIVRLIFPLVDITFQQIHCYRVLSTGYWITDNWL